MPPKDTTRTGSDLVLRVTVNKNSETTLHPEVGIHEGRLSKDRSIFNTIQGSIVIHLRRKARAHVCEAR